MHHRDTNAPTGDKNVETRQENFVAIDMNIYFTVSLLVIFLTCAYYLSNVSTLSCLCLPTSNPSR
jgi:hypothetical protein